MEVFTFSKVRPAFGAFQIVEMELAKLYNQGHYDHNRGTPDGYREITVLRGKMGRALPIAIGSGSWWTL
jgi:hypothetical protein